MRDAACEGDRAEVDRLSDNINHKLTLERLWQIRGLLTNRHEHHPRIVRWLKQQLELVDG